MDLKEYFCETENDPDAQYRSFIAHRHWGWDNLADLAVLADMLRDETVALARELMGKNPVPLAFTKLAMRNVKTMDAPQA